MIFCYLVCTHDRFGPLVGYGGYNRYGAGGGGYNQNRGYDNRNRSYGSGGGGYNRVSCLVLCAARERRNVCEREICSL